MDIFYTTIFGNTLIQWAATAVIFVLSLVASRVTIGRLSKSVHYLTQNRSAGLDDLLVDALEQPLFFLMVLCGVCFGFGVLTVSPSFGSLFQRIWQFLFTLACTWMISRLYAVFHATYMVEYFQKRTAQVDGQLLKTFGSGVQAVIWVMGSLLALNNVGYDITAVIVGLAIAGLAIALAAQDFVANLFGGVTLFTQQPFKVQEHVEVGEMRGVVKQIGIRTTTLTDEQGHDILVPNRYFAQNPVKNISSRESYLVDAVLPLEIHSSPDKIDMLMGFMRSLPDRNHEILPDPVVGIVGIRNNAICIEYRFSIKKLGRPDRYPTEYAKLSAIRTEVYMAVLNQMAALGLSLAEQR